MSGPSQFVVYLFVSGDALFVGVTLILLGRAVSWMLRQRRGAMWLRLLTVLGVIVFLFSATPLPWWAYTLCVLPPLIGLNVPFRVDDGRRWSRIVRRAQPLVEVILLVAVSAELLERQRLRVQPLEQLPAEVHIIGDSLSAGLTDEQDGVWPNLLSREWQVPVRNHAQPGATLSSALRQAEQVTGEGLVFIEIGGNDLLSGRDSWQIEADLDRLLARLRKPGRTLVMFELPVPPFPSGYEFARLQRRLAHRHGVRLIPRRDFAKALLTPGATSDGLHLTPIGHQALASLCVAVMVK